MHYTTGKTPQQQKWEKATAAHNHQAAAVENPYLFDKRLITGLVLARHRGVDVRALLPRVNDFDAGGRGNLVTANYLLQLKEPISLDWVDFVADLILEGF